MLEELLERQLLEQLLKQLLERQRLEYYVGTIKQLLAAVTLLPENTLQVVVPELPCLRTIEQLF